MLICGVFFLVNVLMECNFFVIIFCYCEEKIVMGLFLLCFLCFVFVFIFVCVVTRCQA